MQALGMIETKGLLAAIEAADTMLKAADVAFLEKQKVGGGRVTVLITGDVAAVKAAVDAGVTAVKQIQADCLLSCHVIARPHDETSSLLAPGEAAQPPAKESTGSAGQPPEPVEVPAKAEPKTGKKNKADQE